MGHGTSRGFDHKSSRQVKGCLSRAHHVVDGTHIAHVVSEQSAHLLLPPVSCCMQGRPPVDVPAVHVHPALQKNPEQAEEEVGEDKQDVERNIQEEKCLTWCDAVNKLSLLSCV